MDEGMSFEDFLDKIEWEGGVAEAIRYGLTVDDLSEEARQEQPVFVTDYTAATLAVRAADKEIEALLDEM